MVGRSRLMPLNNQDTRPQAQIERKAARALLKRSNRARRKNALRPKRSRSLRYAWLATCLPVDRQTRIVVCHDDRGEPPAAGRLCVWCGSRFRSRSEFEKHIDGAHPISRTMKFIVPANETTQGRRGA